MNDMITDQWWNPQIRTIEIPPPNYHFLRSDGVEIMRIDCETGKITLNVELDPDQAVVDFIEVVNGMIK